MAARAVKVMVRSVALGVLALLPLQTPAASGLSGRRVSVQAAVAVVTLEEPVARVGLTAQVVAAE